MSLAPGTRLGPYEVVSFITAGGMGEVYRAIDTRLQRTVAIKILSPHGAGNATHERFEREARAISRLNHPNICTVYDVGREDGREYLVLEYLEGETLADRVSKGPVEINQALKYAAEIADGIDEAHRLGIIHRDLKPGNIMLTKSGPKILDFGLAKLRKNTLGQIGNSDATATETQALTQDGMVVGTLPYMAPEQLEGKGADARSDIFSFGSLLYEMLTGRKAFAANTRAGVISAILRTDPQPFSLERTGIAPALNRLVRKCLAKDPMSDGKPRVI